MARILVAYDTTEGQTRKIAEHIAERASSQGHDAIPMNIAEFHQELAERTPDGLIIGASIHVGKHSQRFVEFLENRRMWLDGLPVAFFSVSLSASGDFQQQQEAEGYVAQLLQQTGWQPSATTTIGGSLRYRRYGFLKRLLMRRISKRAGRSTDTTRDHEYTDWPSVDQFTDSFLKQFEQQPPSYGALKEDGGT